MLGLYQERLCRGISDGAAETRRRRASTPSLGAHLPCSWIGSRCRVRTRKAAESHLRGFRISRDAVPAPSVVTDVSASEDIFIDGSDVELQTVLGLDESNDDDDLGYNPAKLSPEQLASRRLSGQAASTSTSNGNGSTSVQRPAGSGGVGPPSVSGRTFAASGSTFPAFPRPGGASTAASGLGPPAGPSIPAQVPPEAAQLYAGSSVAGNLSSTAGSADVLTPLLDSLQLEPPGPSGPGGSASNAQRVYRTSSVEAAGGGAAAVSAAEPRAGSASAAAGSGGTAAGPILVRRKRARTRVLDASELLLARDEAVRTELISKTWNDLLRFEERLGGAAGSRGSPATAGRSAAAPAEVEPAAPAGRATAPAASPPTAAAAHQELSAAGAAAVDVQQPVAASLEDVLGFLATTAADLQDEQAAEQAAEQAQLQRAAARSAQLMSEILRAPTWQRLARLYLKHGRAFSVPHLVATLTRLARFDASGLVFRGRGRRVSFDRVWEMVAKRVAFAAPRMTGSQVVRVVAALNALPARSAKRVELTLVAVQRILRYSSHTMQPLQQQQEQEQQAVAMGGSGTGNAQQQQQQQERAGQITTVTAASRRRGARPAAAATVARLGRGTAGAATGLVNADGQEGQVAMGSADYAALCYTLGRMNTRARPWRISLRLPPSVGRRLLLGSYSQMQPPPLQQQQQQQQQQQYLGIPGPREFAGLLYGLGCMRLSPPAPWMYAFYVGSVRALSAMSDVQLTMLMYGACRLKVKPPPQWIEAYLAALGPRLRGLDGAGLAAAAHALGRLKYKPRPPWMEAFMTAAHDALARGGLRPGEMSQLARGLMFLGSRPPEDLQEVLWGASGVAMERGEFSPAQLVNLAWALGSLKVPIPRRWYEQLVLQMRKCCHQLRPYHRRRLLAALHAFGCRDLPRWYQVLRVPLTEMPGYAAWSAQQAKQRALAHHAKAAKHGQQSKQHAAAGPQGQAEAQDGPGPRTVVAETATSRRQQQQL